MIADRLAAVRQKIQRAGVDILIVQSTDAFLNEYVPTEESARVWISGFTGSMGDVVITAREAYVVVDGRYWIQAEKETDSELYQVVRVPHGTGIETAVIELVKQLAKQRRGRRPARVGFETDRTTPRSVARLRGALENGVSLHSLYPSPVEAARGDERPEASPLGLRLVDEASVGMTVADKLEKVGEWLAVQDADALLVQRLDDIAYLANLRGTQLPYQATFKAVALATPATLLVGIDANQVSNTIQVERPDVSFVSVEDLWAWVQDGDKRIAFDPDHNTEYARMTIAEGGSPIEAKSPIAVMKAQKTSAELKSMKTAFRRADQVVHAAIQWACREVHAGRRVTEASFADRVHATFQAHGAVGLSFKVISAAGKNGAIIHYSQPSSRRALKEGELMLLDTGAYFAEGYATDLTRTFLVGSAKTKATDQQRRYYTLVLKASIAGMRAVFPEGTMGSQVDAMVRAPLWAAGLNYAHGTGHGVGVNVHEAPPRIGPSSDTPLEPGHVFSIEPGVYLPKFGGVRIENLCTVEPVPDLPGFLRVVPLTFSPLDKRLIEPRLLDASEKAWLRAYQSHFKPAAITVNAPPARVSKGRGRVRAGRTVRRKAARRPR